VVALSSRINACDSLSTWSVFGVLSDTGCEQLINMFQKKGEYWREIVRRFNGGIDGVRY
jgi:hypothetical protein